MKRDGFGPCRAHGVGGTYQGKSLQSFGCFWQAIRSLMVAGSILQQIEPYDLSLLTNDFVVSGCQQMSLSMQTNE